VKVKNITRICFMTRGEGSKKGHLMLGNSLLGKIIIENDSCCDRVGTYTMFFMLFEGR
jgi:hypothetical protein